MSVTKAVKTCVSKEGIEYHYDLSNEFYELFLDEKMMYSCALFEDEYESLAVAQQRKIEYHMNAAKVKNANKILDIGCGWGGILKHAVDHHNVSQGIGLTLSDNQHAYISKMNHPKIEARIESWQDHKPEGEYDAIISIGAFPHFARPELTTEQKIAGYRNFFERAHQWLKPQGVLSLETMGHGYLKPEDGSPFFEKEIFPESDLPTLAEIVLASEGFFEITFMRNDLKDYEMTNEYWRRRLKRNKEEAIALVGLDNYNRYIKYFGFMSIGFCTRRLNLFRLSMRRIDR